MRGGSWRPRLVVAGLMPLLAIAAGAAWAVETLPRPELVPAKVAVADVLLPSASPAVALAASVPATPELRELRLLYPLGRLAEQIDPWGWRWSDSRRAWRMHTGVDLAAATGTPVLAARAGQVRLVESVGGYGLSVLIDHGQGLETLYAHLSQVLVQPGEAVEAGAPIGLVGMSGAASGPHLHFELRQRASSGEAALTAMDPTPHLPPLLPPPPPPAAIATIGP